MRCEDSRKKNLNNLQTLAVVAGQAATRNLVFRKRKLFGIFLMLKRKHQQQEQSPKIIEQSLKCQHGCR